MAEYESKKAGDLVSRLVDAFGGTDEYGLVPFVRRWSEIVGTDVAAHSRVLDLRNGALVVGVDHPAWVQRLHMEKGQVLRTIHRRFPQIPVRYMHFIVVDDIRRGIPANHGEERTDFAEVPRRAPETAETPKAEKDADFQTHLEGLRRALEARDSD